MTSLALTPVALYWLAKAGWYQGRRVSLTEFDAAYSKAGLEAAGAVRAFLAEFGGLEGDFETNLGVRGHFAFDPRRSLENVRPKRYQDDGDEPRIPVGELPFSHAVFLMTACGRTYWYFDDLGDIAESPIAALNAIFLDGVLPDSGGVDS